MAEEQEAMPAGGWLAPTDKVYVVSGRNGYALRNRKWLEERGMPKGAVAYRVEFDKLRLVPVRVEDYTAVNYVLVEQDMVSSGVLPALSAEEVGRTLNGEDTPPPDVQVDSGAGTYGPFRRAT